MKKSLLALAAVCAMTSGAAFAQQAESPWLVRVRAVNLDSTNGDTTGLGLSVNNKVIPELDITYFFTPNIAAELILTYPQKHTVRLGGTPVGSLKELPPTLLGQYHFTGLGAFKPYLGAGVNYTRYSSVDIAGGAVSIKKSSWGPALQAGLDYALDKNWVLNFDVKKVWMDTKVTGAGLNDAKYKVDPWLIGVGVGYRF